jgi:hypothetical protein
MGSSALFARRGGIPAIARPNSYLSSAKWSRVCGRYAIVKWYDELYRSTVAPAYKTRRWFSPPRLLGSVRLRVGACWIALRGDTGGAFGMGGARSGRYRLPDLDGGSRRGPPFDSYPAVGARLSAWSNRGLHV